MTDAHVTVNHDDVHPAPTEKPSFLQRLSARVDQSISALSPRRRPNVRPSGIAGGFRRWGLFVAARPYSVIVCTTVFALLWGVAFLKLFKTERDNEDLFTPNDARSFEDKKFVERVYGFNGVLVSFAPASDQLHPDGRLAEQARILCVKSEKAVEEENGTRELLGSPDSARHYVQELFRVYQEVKSFEVIYDDEPYVWDDVCVRPSNTSDCRLTSVLDVWHYNETTIMADTFNPLRDINSDEPLMNRFGIPLALEMLLGRKDGAECPAERNRTCNVEVFGMSLLYEEEPEEIDGAEYDPQSLEWIEGIADRVRELSKTMTLDCYVADEVLVNEEATVQLQKDIRLLTIGYVQVVVYTNIVLFKNSCLSCKMHLSMASLLGIGFAILTAFGIAQTVGLKFNAVVQVLPFLMLGLGIDDTFVIIGAYQRLPSGLPVAEKIAQTLERAGSSIFVTSATDCCAFAMGLYTKLPAMQSFAAYAALAVFFDFIYQVTFFVAFLVIESRREARYRTGASAYGLQVCCTANVHEENAVTEKPPAGLEMKVTVPSTSESLQTEEETSNGQMESSVWRKMCGTGYHEPSTPNFSTKLAGTYLPCVTLHPVGRIAVLVVECALLGLAVYGCTKVSMDFRFIEWFVVDGSASDIAFGLGREYFFGNQQFFSVYTKEAASGDYFHHQDELAALKTALDNDPYVVGPVRTWYEGYSDWLGTESHHQQELINGSAPDASSFNAWLLEYLSGHGVAYNESIIFSDGPDRHILSSRIDAVTVDSAGGRHDINLLDSIRASIEKAAPSFDPIAYAEAFLFFDGYRVIAWETIRNVMMAAIGVFLMTAIALASIPMAVIVVGMIALTDLVVVGYMWYADLYFNPVTAINMVLVVGIAVDYSAHIAHSFLILSGDRLSRAKGALEHIGGEVISGAFTTWLGIVVMGFAEHYFFQAFFRMFFAIIVTGAWHGLVLLPVILSFVGTEPYVSRITKP